MLGVPAFLRSSRLRLSPLAPELSSVSLLSVSPLLRDPASPASLSLRRPSPSADAFIPSKLSTPVARPDLISPLSDPPLRWMTLLGTTPAPPPRAPAVPPPESLPPDLMSLSLLPQQPISRSRSCRLKNKGSSDLWLGTAVHSNESGGLCKTQKGCQFKNSLKHVNSLLGKHPTSPYVLALKALTLERMGKREEALSTCLNAKELLYSDDSALMDDLTLSTLQIVFERLNHLDLATNCYEHACGKFPNNLDIMMGLFNCCVREYSFVRQQQVGCPGRRQRRRDHRAGAEVRGKVRGRVPDEACWVHRLPGNESLLISIIYLLILSAFVVIRLIDNISTLGILLHCLTTIFELTLRSSIYVHLLFLTSYDMRVFGLVPGYHWIFQCYPTLPPRGCPLDFFKSAEGILLFLPFIRALLSLRSTEFRNRIHVILLAIPILLCIYQCDFFVSVRFSRFVIAFYMLGDFEAIRLTAKVDHFTSIPIDFLPQRTNSEDILLCPLSMYSYSIVYSTRIYDVVGCIFVRCPHANPYGLDMISHLLLVVFICICTLYRYY